MVKPVKPGKTRCKTQYSPLAHTTKHWHLTRFVPLIMTLWAWPLSRFQTISLSAHPYHMGESVTGTAVVQVNNSHCSHHVHQDSHFIKEVNQVCQAWLSLGVAMLTTPDGLFVLTVPRNAFHDKLSHHLFPGIDMRLRSL